MSNVPFVFFGIFFAIVLIGLIYYFTYYRPRYLEHKNFVKNVLEKNFDVKYEFKPLEKDELVQTIKQYKMIPSGSTYQIQDAIYDMGYTSYDMHVTHTQSSGKSSHTVTDFLGKLYVIDIELATKFIVKEARWSVGYRDFSKFETEVIDFNKLFNCYVLNEFEAQKIFTPSNIKQLYELCSSDYDKTMLLYDKKLYVFIYNSKRNFEGIENNEKAIIEDYKAQRKAVEDYIKIFKGND
jgi:hypothetical protein